MTVSQCRHCRHCVDTDDRLTDCDSQCECESVDSAKSIFLQHWCVKITDNSSATVLQLRHNLCNISPRLILCQFNCHNRIMIVVHTHKKNTDTTSSVCFPRSAHQKHRGNRETVIHTPLPRLFLRGTRTGYTNCSSSSSDTVQGSV